MNVVKLFVFLVVFGTYCHGQVTQQELIGQWKVNRVVQKSPNAELRGVLEGFKSATFHFMDNGNFKLSTASKAPTFQMLLRMTENAQWKFNAEGQYIKIGREADGYSIMGIAPSLNEGNMHFSMEESEMVFEMKKAQ